MWAGKMQSLALSYASNTPMTNAEREAATATALVAEAKAGDQRAFEALVKR